MIRAFLNRSKIRQIANIKRQRDAIEADIETARRNKKRVRQLYIAAKALAQTQMELERRLW